LKGGRIVMMSTSPMAIDTNRGDREKRRAAVLAAAAEIVRESGCEALSMRNVAARAGVSAGATYQWFQGKDEILCQLYVDRLEIGLARIEALPPGMGLEELIHQIFVWHRPLWRDLGAWAIDFVDATPPDESHVVNLLAARDNLLATGLTSLREAAANSGAQITDSHHLGPHIWATATVTAQRADLLPAAEASEYTAFVARTFTKGITE